MDRAAEMVLVLREPRLTVHSKEDGTELTCWHVVVPHTWVTLEALVQHEVKVPHKVKICQLCQISAKDISLRWWKQLFPCNFSTIQHPRQELCEDGIAGRCGEHALETHSAAHARDVSALWQICLDERVRYLIDVVWKMAALPFLAADGHAEVRQKHRVPRVVRSEGLLQRHSELHVDVEIHAAEQVEHGIPPEVRAMGTYQALEDMRHDGLKKNLQVVQTVGVVLPPDLEAVSVLLKVFSHVLWDVLSRPVRQPDHFWYRSQMVMLSSFKEDALSLERRAARTTATLVQPNRVERAAIPVPRGGC